MNKSLLRQYQDLAEAKGWRIAMIPYDDPTKAMKHDTNWPSLLFMVIFMASTILFVVADTLSRDIALMGIGGGLLGMFISVFIKMRLKYKHWVKVPAQCLDRELQVGRGSKGYAWSWRWLCEYQLAGSTYRVTPTYWLSWGPGNDRAKRRAISFGKKISDDTGNMELWINPENPLQAEVVGHDIKDVLLH